MQLLFWACVAFVFYAYFGYPAALYAVARLFGKPVRRAAITPAVSFIIAARNEAARIRSKIENTLPLDYPRDLLEIIVASDCSDDGTHDIVREYVNRGVRLVAAPERRGKEFAQSLAIKASSGEVLVFSDASTRLEPNGVRNIVQNFADSEIGCVSSVDQVTGADGQPGGEGAYVRYEMLIRSLESRVGSVVGLSGSFFAARREVCDPWPVDLPSDFNTLLNTVRKGMRGVSDPTAVGCYADLNDPHAEYARKVRTVSRGLRSLGRNLHLLNPLRHGLSAWELFSHKLCRWLVPFAMVGALVSSLVLAQGSTLYGSLAAFQVLGYAFAAFVIATGTPVGGAWKIVPFFVLVNLSILHAWFNAVRGRGAVIWEPSRR
jgi:glycosyltransferase involved in cell wall biosynthesis